MELNHLKYFYTVAKEGSFTRASRVLRVQQPTLSKMVRLLEEELSLVLFDRHKKGVRLTPAGQEVFLNCEQIFNQVDEIRSRSSYLKSELGGPLAFGATDSVATYLIPSYLNEFLKLHPKVVPSIFSGSSNLVCEEIRSEKIDFGIFFTVPDQQGFEIKQLAVVPFHLVISSAHVQNKTTLQTLIISRDIDYPKRRLFPVMEMLKKNQVSLVENLKTAITCNNLDAQKEMAKQGLGVALLPEFMVLSSFQNGNLTAFLPKKKFSYSLNLVTRKGKVLSQNALRFLELVKQKVQT